MKNDRIIIPEKYYIGMNQHNKNHLPVGCMTPWGEDAAAKKRMFTVDKQPGRDKLPSVVVDNKPMVGFKLTTIIRKGDYGSPDKWRIEDPRGFQLEINSINLAKLISTTTIENGEILDNCVWAYAEGSNVLLSVESDSYKNATKMTKIANTSTKWSEVKIGYKIMLQSGLEGTYLGKMHTLFMGHHTVSPEIINEISSSSSSCHVILTDSSKITVPTGIIRELHFISTPTLSSIVDNSVELNAVAAELLVNQYIADKTCYVIKSKYGRVLLAAANVIKTKDLLISLDISDKPTDLLKSNTHKNVRYFFKLKDNSLCTLGNDYSEMNCKLVDEQLFSSGIISFKTVNTNRIYDTMRLTKKIKVDETDIVEVYTISIKLNTKLNNTIQARFG